MAVSLQKGPPPTLPVLTFLELHIAPSFFCILDYNDRDGGSGKWWNHSLGHMTVFRPSNYLLDPSTVTGEAVTYSSIHGSAEYCHPLQRRTGKVIIKGWWGLLQRHYHFALKGQCDCVILLNVIQELWYLHVTIYSFWLESICCSCALPVTTALEQSDLNRLHGE